jgi:predicted metal-dependent hydrolase
MVTVDLTSLPEFAQGMRLHNDGAYYDAHEAWEELWNEEPDGTELRLFIQGLIQVTSAFHKVFVQKQPASAERLLARGLDKLGRYADDYGGVAVADFRRQARACAEALASGIVLHATQVPMLRWVRPPTSTSTT